MTSINIPYHIPYHTICKTNYVFFEIVKIPHSLCVNTNINNMLRLFLMQIEQKNPSNQELRRISSYNIESQRVPNRLTLKFNYLSSRDIVIKDRVLWTNPSAIGFKAGILNYTVISRECKWHIFTRGITVGVCIPLLGISAIRTLCIFCWYIMLYTSYYVKNR